MNENFNHKLCLTYMCKLQFWHAGASDRIMQIEDWLTDNIGNENYDFTFEDIEWRGEWMLYTRSKEDLTAFMLRWSSV